METESNPHLTDVFVSITDRGIADPAEHNLLELLAVAVNAVLVGAETFADIESWARERLDWLRSYFPLDSGIPSRNVFGCLFGLMPTGAFEAACWRWLGSTLPTLKSGASADFASKAGPRASQVEAARQHLVGAFAAGAGLTLRQRATIGQADGSRGNGGTVLSEVLASLSVSECIVTIDAPGLIDMPAMPTALAQAIRNQGGDYVLAVGNSHPALTASLRDFHSRFMTDPQSVPHAEYKMTAKQLARGGAGRCLAFIPHDHLAPLEKWPDLRSFAFTDPELALRDPTSVMPKFYFSSLPANAERLALAIGSPGSSNPPPLWRMSIAFAEDQMRVRARQAARNLGVLRRLTEHLIRIDPVKRKGGIKARRFIAGISDDYRAHLLGLG